MKVTVVIDTYNYGHLISRAIESVLSQTYSAADLEILVIDDGSTDGTEARVRRFGAPIEYVLKEHGGQASALNLGVRRATGEVVCFLDADDYFYPDKVASVVELARSCPEAGLIYNAFDIVRPDGRVVEASGPHATWTGCRLPAGEALRHIRDLVLLGHPWACPTSAISVRRSLLAAIPIPEEPFLHSPDLFIGCVLPFLTEVAFVPSAQTAHVFHGGNAGFLRSTTEKEELHRAQIACVRFRLQELGVEPLSYLGQGYFHQGVEVRLSPAARLALARREARTILRAPVAKAVKRQSLRRLALATLLPRSFYAMLRGWKLDYLRRRGRRSLRDKNGVVSADRR